MQLTLLQNKRYLSCAIIASTLFCGPVHSKYVITVEAGPFSTNGAGVNPLNIKSTGAITGNGPLITMNQASSAVSVAATTANAGFGLLSTNNTIINTDGVSINQSVTTDTGSYIKAGIGGGFTFAIGSPTFTFANSGTIEAVDPNNSMFSPSSTGYNITNTGTIKNTSVTPIVSSLVLVQGTASGQFSNLGSGTIQVDNLGASSVIIAQANSTFTNFGKMVVTNSVNGSTVYSGQVTASSFTNESSGTVTMPLGKLFSQSGTGAFTFNNKGSMKRTDAVNNNSTAVYISGTNSGKIENSGTITNADNTGVAITFDTGTFSGNFINSGTLSSGTGILLNANSISAGITNSTSGNIIGLGTVAGKGQGILVDNYPGGAPSTAIINQGKITGQTAGIEIKTNTMAGGITNSGTITGTTASAIVLNNASLTGDFNNSGTITTGAGVTAPLILMNTGTIIGAINNNLGGKMAAAGNNQDALSITFAPTGKISNVGTLTSASGRAIFSNQVIPLGIENTGTMSTATGAYVVNLEDAGNTAFSHLAGTLTGDVIMGDASTFTMGTSTPNEKLTFNGSLTRKNAAGANTYLIKGGTFTGKTVTTIGPPSVSTTTAMTGVPLGTTAFKIWDANVVGNIDGANAGDSYEIRGAALEGNLTGVAGNETLTMSNGIAAPTLGSLIDGTVSDIKNINILNGTQQFSKDVTISGDMTINTNNTTAAIKDDVVYLQGITKVGGKIELQKNSVVQLSKDVTTPNFNNKGGIVVLNAPVKITGNYTQTTVTNPLPDIDSTGTLKVSLTPSVNNTLTVTGSASVAGQVTIDFSSSTYLATGQKINVISAAGLIDNGVTIAPINSQIVKLTKDPSPLPGKLSIVATRLTTYDKLAGTPIGVQIGSILEQVGKAGPTGDAATVLGQLDFVSNNIDFNSALLQIAPDVNGSVPVESLSNQFNFLKSISTRLDIVRAQQLYDDSGYGYGYAAGDWDLSGQSTWVQGYSSFARQEKRNGINGYGANTYGVAIGTDALADDALRIGLSIGGGLNKIKSKKPLINTLDITSAQASLYGSIIGYSAYIDWQFMGARNWYKGKRNLLIGLVNMDLSSNYKAWQYGAKAEGGISFYQGSLEITPIVGAYVSYLTIEKYREKGATGITLDVQSAGYNYFEGRGGVKWAYPLEFTNGYFVPEIRTIYNREFVNDLQKVTAQYTSGGPAFTVLGYAPAKASMDLGASISFFANNNYSLRFNYDFNSKASYRSSSYSLTFRREFLS